MVPFLHLGPVSIPSYGLLLAAAFLVATGLTEREFRRKGLGRNRGWDSGVVAIIVGLIGARINYMFEHPERGHDLLKTLFSGAGLTWYGGFILGLLAVLVFWRMKKVPILSGLDAVAPAIALGYAIARIGCQLSGDGDYGKPSTLPWAMAYPNGTVPTLVRVHPTPVYELLLMLVVFSVLWGRRKRKQAAGFVFWLYLIGQGLERFLVEFVRTNKPVLVGLTEAQIVSIAMILVGAGLLLRRRPAGLAQTTKPV
jgi:phosphatidylglycerol:prolipoprotein diacylglycerol transferase